MAVASSISCCGNKRCFIISFAPYTLYYAALKQLGSLAPGPSKATRAYLHKEADVVATLEQVRKRVFGIGYLE